MTLGSSPFKIASSNSGCLQDKCKFSICKSGNYLSFMICKMKEVLVAPDISTKIIDSPIPEADENDVVVKVVFAGSNPKVIGKCRGRSRASLMMTGLEISRMGRAYA